MLSKLSKIIFVLFLGAFLNAQTVVPLNPLIYFLPGPMSNNSDLNLDSAGEYMGVIGQVHLKAGTGTKTCSSAGCQFYFDIGTLTWANVGTTARVGIQDLDTATGLGDGTFDVFADLVPGTETIIAGNNKFAAESGTKNLSENDVVVLQITLTSVAGGDSLQVDRQQRTPIAINNFGFPYGAENGGSPTRGLNPAKFIIEFDDGTFGWITANPVFAYTQPASQTTVTFGNGSTPDEYAVVFTPESLCPLYATSWSLDDIVSGDDFEYDLYSDPLGSPSLIEAVIVNPALQWNTTNDRYITGNFTATRNLSAGVQYGISVRPTTANTISLVYWNIGATYEAAYKAAQNMTFSFYSRSDNTGAFSTEISTAVPKFAIHCAGLVQ